MMDPITATHQVTQIIPPHCSFILYPYLLQILQLVSLISLIISNANKLRINYINTFIYHLPGKMSGRHENRYRPTLLPRRWRDTGHVQ